MGRPTTFPLALPEWYAPLTRAYNQVAPRMHTRRLLEDGRGALWYDDQRQPVAFFAFKAGPAPVPGSLHDLVSDSVLFAGPVEPGRIYAI